VIEDRRPVVLEQHYLIDDHLLPMFVASDGEVVPKPGESAASEARREESEDPPFPSTRNGHRPAQRPIRPRPNRANVVELLAARTCSRRSTSSSSRKGCDAAVAQCSGRASG